MVQILLISGKVIQLYCILKSFIYRVSILKNSILLIFIITLLTLLNYGGEIHTQNQEINKKIAVNCDKLDLKIFYSTMNKALQNKLNILPVNEIIVETGKSFIGTDYEAGILDEPERESLVIHLTGMDCVTFVEYTLAFARCINDGKSDFTVFQDELIKIRYRDGLPDGYLSRLHYFSDWIDNGEKKNILKNVTIEVGGITYKKEINFMSENYGDYKHLLDNPENIEKCKEIENGINKRHEKRPMNFIPKDKIALIESRIQSGDIIAVTTDIKGMDIRHVGIALKMPDGRIHLLNAPRPGKKVEISLLPLAELIARNRHQTGIMAVRAL